MHPKLSPRPCGVNRIVRSCLVQGRVVDDTPPARLHALLRPAADELLGVTQIRPLVNKVQNGGPELVEVA
jgi:hypothetical protein